MGRKDRVKVNSSDHFRALLTDTSPEDVTTIFSNSGVYHWLTNRVHSIQSNGAPGSKTVTALVKAIFDFDAAMGAKWAIGATVKSTVPYVYKIRVNEHKHRQLAIPHPRSQISWCNIYREFWPLITYYCRESNVSLRAPTGVATSYYIPNVNNDSQRSRLQQVGVETEESAKLSRYAASYFSYSGCRLFHQFFNSEKFVRLEARYNHFWMLDISNCFGSIYTHSLSWVTWGKDAAKRHMRSVDHGFAGRFDEAIRAGNWNETHGILVGTEVARVFAELILQSVDTSTQRRSTEIAATANSKFEFYRYVDDFLLFATDDQTCENFVRVLSDELSKFKLVLGEGKTCKLRRPFITSQSHAIERCREIIESLLDRIYQPRPHAHNVATGQGVPTEGGPNVSAPTESTRTFGTRAVRHLHRPRDLKVWVIRKLRSAAAGLPTGYAPVAGFMLQRLCREVIELSNRLANENESSSRIATAISLLLDVCFFIYTVDASIRNSARLSDAVLQSMRAVQTQCLEGADTLHQVVFEGCVSFLDAQVSQQGNQVESIESINMFLLLSELPNDFDIPVSRLLSWLPVGPSDGEPGYFSLMAALRYVGRRTTLTGELRNIESTIEKFLINSTTKEHAFESTKYSLMLLDTLSCPFVSIGLKRKVLKDACSKFSISIPATNIDADAAVGLISGHPFFTDWDDAAIERNLVRRPGARAY